jgi:hypothetical protein
VPTTELEKSLNILHDFEPVVENKSHTTALGKVLEHLAPKPKPVRHEVPCKKSTCTGGIEANGYLAKPTIQKAHGEFISDCGWTGTACSCFCWATLNMAK